MANFLEIKMLSTLILTQVVEKHQDSILGVAPHSSHVRLNHTNDECKWADGLMGRDDCGGATNRCYQ